MNTFTIEHLRERYESGNYSVRQLALSLQVCFKAVADPAIFIHWLSMEELEPYLVALEALEPNSLPLYGIPFAIKDNIDLAGIPTTAGCPDYSYVPTRSAFVVQQLIDAGAIPIGKTNLDQFATGLVGVRSPYGVPVNPKAPDHIPGGSSSGSAVAVAQQLAVFALGTDTAGSGRVPAAYNGLVGLKPTRGILSNTGVVPACRTLDCVSIFAHNLRDAHLVLQQAISADSADAFSREYKPTRVSSEHPISIGIPQDKDLNFFGDSSYASQFQTFVEALGDDRRFELKPIDFTPFKEAASLLYQGPWIAERYAAVGQFIEENPESVYPVTRKIIEGGKGPSAVDTFEAFYKLRSLKKVADRELEGVDCILTPTTGTHYTVEQVLQDPVQTNTNLGYYTNFMNLLDYAALAFPAGETSEKRPFGLTLFTHSQADEKLLQIASEITGGVLGEVSSLEETLQIAVCGAHMRRMPLNSQLIALGATYVDTVKSAPHYRFVCLGDKTPLRPGMIRVPEKGVSIEMELWDLPLSSVGEFLSKIQNPLGLGSVELENQEWTKGFICEGIAAETSIDISSFGSWKNYLSSL